MIRSVLVAAAVLSLGACTFTSKPLMNFDQSAVDPGRTVQEVEQAVLEALKSRGWKVEEQTPGRIVAKIDKRDKHTATIAVTYSATQYSIAYVDSEGLNYDEKTGDIHRNYNRWVNNLNADIQSRV
jgi:outer membrane lipopolysaccharide assembly protein LptE/RlpB